MNYVMRLLKRGKIGPAPEAFIWERKRKGRWLPSPARQMVRSHTHTPPPNCLKQDLVHRFLALLPALTQERQGRKVSPPKSLRKKILNNLSYFLSPLKFHGGIQSNDYIFPISVSASSKTIQSTRKQYFVYLTLPRGDCSFQNIFVLSGEG